MKSKQDRHWRKQAKTWADIGIKREDAETYMKYSIQLRYHLSGRERNEFPETLIIAIHNVTK